MRITSSPASWMSGTSPASKASRDRGPAIMMLITGMRDLFDYDKITPLNVLVSRFQHRGRPARHPLAAERAAPPCRAVARGRTQPGARARGDGPQRADH